MEVTPSGLEHPLLVEGATKQLSFVDGIGEVISLNVVIQWDSVNLSPVWLVGKDRMPPLILLTVGGEGHVKGHLKHRSAADAFDCEFDVLPQLAVWAFTPVFFGEITNVAVVVCSDGFVSGESLTARNVRPNVWGKSRKTILNGDVAVRHVVERKVWTGESVGLCVREGEVVELGLLITPVNGDVPVNRADARQVGSISFLVGSGLDCTAEWEVVTPLC